MNAPATDNPHGHQKQHISTPGKAIQLLRNRQQKILRSRELLQCNDPKTAILEHLERYGYSLVNGRLIYQRTKPEPESDWVYVNYSRNTKCALWHNAIFDTFGFIPSPCHSCFKVVAKPGTVKELFVLYELSKSLKIQSKCGAERREFVFGPYSQFFYVSGFEEGLRCYHAVKQAISESLAPNVPVVLKCGCTRYELEMGPSKQWEVTPEQIAFEDFLKETVSRDILMCEMESYAQQKEQVDAIQNSWFEWAYHIGDATYLEFTDGRPLFPKGSTYHETLSDYI